MASKGENTGAQNLDRDMKSIQIRRDKKKAKKVTGKAQKADSFSFQYKERKNRTHAEKAMPTGMETPTHRLFSVRAWDRNGDEIWSDDKLTIDAFTQEWPSMKKWALTAKFGEIITSTKGMPLPGEFFFRRVV